MGDDCLRRAGRLGTERAAGSSQRRKVSLGVVDAYHNTSFKIAGRIEGRATRLARPLGDHAIRLLGI